MTELIFSLLLAVYQYLPYFLCCYLSMLWYLQVAETKGQNPTKPFRLGNNELAFY
jgi:hypothetical protein